MNYTKNFIKEQVEFCNILMERLNKEIKHTLKDESDTIYCCMTNGTRYKNDIIRLRRELLTLSQMITGHDI